MKIYEEERLLPWNKIYVQREQPEQTEPTHRPRQIFSSLNTRVQKVRVSKIVRNRQLVQHNFIGEYHSQSLLHQHLLGHFTLNQSLVFIMKLLIRVALGVSVSSN